MIGTTVSGYQVTGLLAEGGMGAVWAAKHPVMGREAVVKLLLPELSHNQEMVRRFFNEAKAAAQITDPGIVQVFDVGHLPDGRAYIVMERLKGQTLAQRLRDRRPAHAADPLQGIRVEETVNILRLIARTLDAAHGHGIVHRDLKPDNIFLVPDRDVVGGERIKILDFGIAKLKGQEGTQANATRAGSVFGTPAYMAPEQCSDAATVDARADLYAVGCIAYELLATIPPHGFGGMEILAAHLRDEPVPVSQRNPAVPPQLEHIINRLLRKNPNERYQTAHELYNALDSVAYGGSAPTAYSVPPNTSAGYAPGSYVSPQRTPEPGSMPFVAQTPTPVPPSFAPPIASAPPLAAIGTAPPQLGTHPPTASSRTPYIIAALAIAAAAAVVVVVMMNKDKAPPAAPPPAIASSAVPVVEKGNPLADAYEARAARKWGDVIAATERVTADGDKAKAKALADEARAEAEAEGNAKQVTAALAANDLAAAQKSLAAIPPASTYRAAAEAAVKHATKVAVVEPKNPKKDPKKDPKKEPKPVDPDEEPIAGLGYDEAMGNARTALKAERYGNAFKFAKTALRSRPGDEEARMTATIAACGMGMKQRALATFPREKGTSFHEIAYSRCFKLGINLQE